MAKSQMTAVRFPVAMIAAVRRFARQDKVTVSQFIRRLVEKEIASPQRIPASADVRLYPCTETVAAGNWTWTIEWINCPQPQSWTR